MKILHGTWIPRSTDNFIRAGAFYLWVETDTISKGDSNLDRYHLDKSELRIFLTSSVDISDTDLGKESEIQYFLLPSLIDRPLPSLELARYLEIELPDLFDLQYWAIDCCQIACEKSNIIKLAMPAAKALTRQLPL